MGTTKYYLLAAFFIGIIWLLAWTGRRIVQKICYSERDRKYFDLSFDKWLKEVWKNEN